MANGRRLACAGLVGILALAACNEGGDESGKAASAAAMAPWTVEAMAPPSPFSGVHGIAVAPSGRIMLGSVVGQSILELDPVTGAITTFMGPPDGMADDIAYGPSGEIAWTGYLTGKVFVQQVGGPVVQVASGLPGANSLAFTRDGRLYFTQVFLGDALYEADVTGASPPRKIAENLGGLNGFEVGADGMIYGPLWFRGVIARVDPKTGKATPVATGFKTPAAANFDSKGRLWALDTATGEVVRIDVASGAKTTVATLPASLDNLAIGPDDSVYVTNMVDGSVHRINPETGETTVLTTHAFAAPADIEIARDASGERLYVADVFSYRTLDLPGGAVTDHLRMYRDALENPIGITVGESHVYLASWAAGTIQQVDRAAGTIIATWHGFAGPVDALEMADGTLLVAEVGGKLLRVSGMDGADRTMIAEGLAGPASLARDATGMIYVSETPAGRVTRIDPSTGAKSSAAEGLSGPEGLAFAADGRLIVVEAGAAQVTAIDLATGARQVLARDLPIGLKAPEGTPPAYLPSGVAVAANGTVYLASDLKNTIYRLTPPAK
jgi:sugar lactone lactonase YvrE